MEAEGEEVVNSSRPTELNCPICGRFKRKITWQDPETKEVHTVDWRCPKVASAGDGNWEHD